jgi:hypothetical protein
VFFPTTLVSENEEIDGTHQELMMLHPYDVTDPCSDQSDDSEDLTLML